MDRPLYVDYNATTPIAPEVLAAMLPYLADQFGNPSSSHAYGHAGRTEPSGVLMAMGMDRARALGAVRLWLGHPTTEDEVDAAATALIASARAISVRASPRTP